jgi:hypothetical protein
VAATASVNSLGSTLQTALASLYVSDTDWYSVMAMLCHLRDSLQFQTSLARALEIRVARKQYMATLFANEPVRLLQHRPELVTQNAIRTSNYLIGH